MQIELREKLQRCIPRWLGYHIPLWNIRWNILCAKVRRRKFWFYMVPRRDGGYPVSLWIDCPCSAREIMEAMERVSQQPDPFRDR